MADYDVYIKPSALKELDTVGSKRARQRIDKTIRALAQDPRPGGSRRLSGKDKYRIRCVDAPHCRQEVDDRLQQADGGRTMLATLFGSKARVKVFAVFMLNPASEFYLGEIRPRDQRANQTPHKLDWPSIN